MAKFDQREGGVKPAERSGADSNREDSDRPGYTQFVKDKRPRTRNVNVQKVERLSRSQLPEGEGEFPRRDIHTAPKPAQEQPRRSFNPNFDRENRPVNKEPRGEWKPREQGDRKPYQPRQDRDFNRESKPRTGFERDSNREYKPRPGFEKDPNREYKPRTGSDGNFNREYKPRPGGFNRNDDRKPYGDSRREFKPRTGGDRDFNRRDDNRSGRPGQERDFNRTPYDKDRRPSGQKPYRDSAPRYDKENYPRFAAPKAEGPMRLNRFISMSGICSRREADDLITAGVVTINGTVATELGTKVMPGDEIRLNGEVIHGEKKVYIVMNKPKGYVTSIEDPHADKTVMDLLKDACTERVYPVGRLDKNSVGVLLITNDGDLTRKLTHPSYNKKKVYQASLDKPLSEADLVRIAEGFELEDGFIAPDAIDYVNPNRKEIGLEIHSGRNRIVRRIFEAVGYHVMKLDRVYFAGLTKQRLKRGAWRFLTPKEVSMLKSGEYE